MLADDVGNLLTSLEGSLTPEKMITSKIQLKDLVEGGIKALISDKESHVKILVEMSSK